MTNVFQLLYHGKCIKSYFLLCIFLIAGISAFSQQHELKYKSQIKPGTKIYVVTNRLADTSALAVQYTNSLQKGSQLTYMRAVYFDIDSIQIVKIDSIRFLSEISEKPDDWLVFVHGDSKTFNGAIERGLDIQYLYDIPVIVFSWPSYDSEINGLENVKNSQQNVIKSTEDFFELLKFLNEFRKSNPSFSADAKLSLFAHSLGNYYLKNLVTQNFILKFRNKIFDNLILNEAAVNEENHKEWVEKLDIQERIYITSNNKDFTLKGFQLFTDEGEQLGEEAAMPLAKNATYLRFTDAVGFRFPIGTTHTYFIGEVADKSNNIRWVYNELLHGMALDLSDKSMFEKRKDGLGFSVKADIK